MTPQSAIAKGKLLEDWIVQRLRLSGLDTRAYRQKGSGNGLNKGDIWNDLNLCIEAKNTAKPNLNKTLKQTNREALGTQIPIMVWHMPNTPLENSHVVIDWHYFEQLLLKTKEPNLVNPDREFKWKVQRMVDSAKAVLKELGQ